MRRSTNIASSPVAENLPEIRCYLADQPCPVTPAHPLWHTPLPQAPDGSAASGSLTVCDDAHSVTYGVYFGAVAAFLTDKQCAVLRLALEQEHAFAGHTGDIQRLALHLEKHGAFYHPTRVDVALGDDHVLLVVNVAASSQGRRLIAREYDLLANPQWCRPDVLPRVYAIIPALPPFHLPMFVGQWLADYHEFHLSHDVSDHCCRIRVWHPQNPALFLDATGTRKLFSQISVILTSCYNITSGAQLSNWRHAAGDFVVCLTHGHVSVRLITARRYQAIFQAGSAGDVAGTLQMLLLFLLHLTLQMRLDRLDGVGPLVWLPNEILEATLEGFWQALHDKPDPDFLPAPLPICLAVFIRQCDAATILELAETVVTGCFQHPQEFAILQEHITAHVEKLHDLLQNHVDGVLAVLASEA